MMFHFRQNNVTVHLRVYFLAKIIKNNIIFIVMDFHITIRRIHNFSYYIEIKKQYIRNVFQFWKEYRNFEVSSVLRMISLLFLYLRMLMLSLGSTISNLPCAVYYVLCTMYCVLRTMCCVLRSMYCVLCMTICVLCKLCTAYYGLCTVY